MNLGRRHLGGAWPGPVYVMESTSPWCVWPGCGTDGYFIVSLEPRLPSIHSTIALALALLATRL